MIASRGLTHHVGSWPFVTSGSRSHSCSRSGGVHADAGDLELLLVHPKVAAQDVKPLIDL